MVAQIFNGSGIVKCKLYAYYLFLYAMNIIKYSIANSLNGNVYLVII